MQVPKEQVVQAMRDRGQGDIADQAEQHLPDQVDLDQHADLLKQHGVEPKELMGHLGL